MEAGKCHVKAGESATWGQESTMCGGRIGCHVEAGKSPCGGCHVGAGEYLRVEAGENATWGGAERPTFLLMAATMAGTGNWRQMVQSTNRKHEMT